MILPDCLSPFYNVILVLLTCVIIAWKYIFFGVVGNDYISVKQIPMHSISLHIISLSTYTLSV